MDQPCLLLIAGPYSRSQRWCNSAHDEEAGLSGGPRQALHTQPLVHALEGVQCPHNEDHITHQLQHSLPEVENGCISWQMALKGWSEWSTTPTPSLAHTSHPTPTLAHTSHPTPSLAHTSHPTPSLEHTSHPTPSLAHLTPPHWHTPLPTPHSPGPRRPQTHTADTAWP